MLEEEKAKKGEEAANVRRGRVEDGFRAFQWCLGCF